MCTLALFALVIAAVLISRRLAQLIGAAVIILGRGPRRGAATAAGAAGRRRLSGRFFGIADVGVLRRERMLGWAR
jgi:hypothetical protein